MKFVRFGLSIFLLAGTRWELAAEPSRSTGG